MKMSHIKLKLETNNVIGLVTVMNSPTELMILYG